PMELNLRNVEVMGRDVSIVSDCEASLNPVVRSIINADNKVDADAKTVRFSLKAHKVFLFDKETEERLFF
ncbi:MAG: ABC transporter ATP-binding protein, partial [Clostridia bacterium]|nr:ABC transporter ATP-binding protein [Clostridia bacterium]